MRSNVPCAIGGDPAEHDLASELPMKSVIRGDYTKSSSIRTNIDGSAAQDSVDQRRRKRSHELHAEVERIGKGDLTTSSCQAAPNDIRGTLGQQH